jgi:FMN phosphatase YigB (HAD superfamily)
MRCAMHCRICRPSAIRMWRCATGTTTWRRIRTCCCSTVPRPLIDELADAGYMLAVATGKTRAGLNRAFEVSGLGPRFHASRCADECHSKPHPQMLEELMTEFGVSADSTLMIGDTTHDLLMARNAGVAALGVAYGAHPRASLEAEAPLFVRRMWASWRSGFGSRHEPDPALRQWRTDRRRRGAALYRQARWRGPSGVCGEAQG